MLQLRAMAVGVLMLILWGMALPCINGCPSDGSECSNCIMTRMKSGCPGCIRIMQCMARCLWAGSSRSKCAKKCDCDSGGYPRLGDCKKCLSHCRCSCSSNA